MNGPAAAALEAPVPSVAALAPWRASLALRFEATDRGTRLSTLRHHGPLRVQRALHPEGAAVCHAIVVHPPGGVAGGDELAIDVDVGRGAHALLTTPGASKLYKSAGRRAMQTVRLKLDGGVVEWLPQETIVFEAAQARLGLDVDVRAGGLALAWDIVTLGREAMGEAFATGVLDTRLAVANEGRTLLEERMHVAGGSRWLASPVGWRGARTCGTLVAAGRDVDDGLLERCREALAPWSPHAAVSRLAPDCVVARFLGASANQARCAFSALWSPLREALAGRPSRPPRIWST